MRATGRCFLRAADRLPVGVAVLDDDGDVAIAEPIVEQPALYPAGKRHIAHAGIVAGYADMVADVGNEAELVLIQFLIDDIGIVRRRSCALREIAKIDSVFHGAGPPCHASATSSQFRSRLGSAGIRPASTAIRQSP